MKLYLILLLIIVALVCHARNQTNSMVNMYVNTLSDTGKGQPSEIFEADFLDIIFKPKSCTLSNAMKDSLKLIAQKLRNDTSCSIRLYAGYSGTGKKNVTLRWRRINAVSTLLVEKEFINGNRIIFGSCALESADNITVELFNKDEIPMLAPKPVPKQE